MFNLCRGWTETSRARQFSQYFVTLVTRVGFVVSPQLRSPVSLMVIAVLTVSTFNVYMRSFLSLEPFCFRVYNVWVCIDYIVDLYLVSSCGVPSLILLSFVDFLSVRSPKRHVSNNIFVCMFRSSFPFVALVLNDTVWLVFHHIVVGGRSID